MTNSIDKSIEEIVSLSMKSAFSVQEEEVVEELTEDEKRKKEISEAIAAAQEARRIAAEKEKELEEVIKYKSEKATTSGEKQKEITEKSVKNKIKINPEMKESIVGKIYDMYNNKYLSEKRKEEVEEDMNKGYVVTAADKKANTPAWQGYKAGKKKKDGTPLYRKADHLEEEEAQKKTLTIEESDKLYLLKANGDVAYEVTDLIMPDPLHELNRYAKETGKNTGSLNKRAGSKVEKGGSKDKALNFVRGMIRKETGKPEGQRKKVKGAKSDAGTGKYIAKAKAAKAHRDKVKKAGFKSSQDYANTMARYGGEDNYKKGRGLGT